MSLRRLVALCSALVPALLGAQASPPPDLVLTGGRIFTADSTRPWAEAVAIRGERIVAVGTTAEVRRMAGRATREIALGGRVVIPGINDTHTHLGVAFDASFSTADTSLAGPALPEVLDSVRAVAARTPPGTWIRGAIGTRMLGDSTARRAALDAAAPRHPVLLRAPWGHGMLVNSAALRAAGIADRAADPLGGTYERDASGRLTGSLGEYAGWAVFRRANASLPDADVVRALRREAEQRLGWGVTSVQDMADAFAPAQTLRVLRAARLPQRVRVVRWPMAGAGGRHVAEWRAVNATPAPRVRVSGVKYVLDGTPIEQGALNRTPYPGRPGWYGRLNFPLDTVRAILRDALRGGDQTMLHVVGDSSLALVLSEMERMAPDSEWRRRRLRLEHASRLGGDFVPRAARLGIVVAQPRTSASLRSWRAAGIVTGYGSDGLPNPFVDMLVAVTAPARPGEAVSREEAVTILTRGSAYAEGMEREKGTLAPGMLADLAVLSQDVFTVPPAALPATTSVLTVVGGRIVHDALARAATGAPVP
ncbi:amidohydrolase [Roseisolibacter agri]|uniref:Amidohydrolase n=1 Tax=Roseisolibacter agri TaxID=2014610 RepID=A0AA37QDM5_9BACT|nr:amidohydrolase [Roseisolibacter agri]GLC24375.1 amidohydrolase [Roseisolibacter agri]